jgi:heat shock protein HtpX
MQIAKRVFLFILVNLLVITTINIVLSLLGVGNYMRSQGIDYQALLVMCVVWGFGGSFISLLISKPMAKWSMGVHVISPDTRDGTERWLLETVHRLSRQAGIEDMPEVGYFENPDPNAFATGATKNSALVAVSSGLMESMDKEQVEGVLGHEVAHVANGDMVTMTLVQGVINVFVLFLARILAAVVSRGERGNGGSQFLLVMLFQVVLSLLGSMVVAAFSRWREYRADAGGAMLAGKQKMISALQALQEAVQRRRRGPAPVAESVAALMISGGIGSLFSTHPPLEDRIARLQGASASQMKSSLID